MCIATAAFVAVAAATGHSGSGSGSGSGPSSGSGESVVDHNDVANALLGATAGGCGLAKANGFCASPFIQFVCPVTCPGAGWKPADYGEDQGAVLTAQFGVDCDSATTGPNAIGNCGQPAIQLTCPIGCKGKDHDDVANALLGVAENGCSAAKANGFCASAFIQFVCPVTCPGAGWMLADYGKDQGAVLAGQYGVDCDGATTGEGAASNCGQAAIRLTCPAGCAKVDNVKQGGNIAPTKKGPPAPDRPDVIREFFIGQSQGVIATCANLESNGYCESGLGEFMCPVTCKSNFTTGDYEVDQDSLALTWQDLNCSQSAAVVDFVPNATLGTDGRAVAPCVFPFEYAGTIYNECSTADTNGRYWCSTSANLTATPDEWDYCDMGEPSAFGCGNDFINLACPEACAPPTPSPTPAPAGSSATAAAAAAASVTAAVAAALAAL